MIIISIFKIWQTINRADEKMTSDKNEKKDIDSSQILYFRSFFIFFSSSKYFQIFTFLSFNVKFSRITMLLLNYWKGHFCAIMAKLAGLNFVNFPQNSFFLYSALTPFLSRWSFWLEPWLDARWKVEKSLA